MGTDPSPHRPSLFSQFHGPFGRLSLAAAVLIGLGLIAQVVLALGRAFDPAELRAVHGGWAIAQGMVPYRDYFESQTPLFPCLLSVLCRILQPELSFEAARTVLTGMRLGMVVGYGLSLLLTWRLAARWRNPPVAWVATALLACHVTYGEYLLEIGSDSLMLVLWLGGLLAAATALSSPRAWRQWGVAGLLWGTALTTSVTALTVVPAVAVGLTLVLWRNPVWRSWSARMNGLAILLAGFTLPHLLTLALLSWQGLLPAAWQDAVTVCLHATRAVSVTEGFGRIVAPNLVFTGLGIAGLLGARRAKTPRRDRAFAVMAAVVVLGNLIIPGAVRHQYLLAVPLLALFAAEAFLCLLDRETPWTPATATALQIGAAVTVGLGLFYGFDALPTVPGLTDYQALHRPFLLWLALTIGGCGILAWRRPKSLTVGLAGVCLALLCLGPMPTVWAATANRADRQWHTMQQLMTVTADTDPVLDGTTGLGVFRRHALAQFHLSPEVANLIDHKARHDLVIAMDEGRLAPKAVILDSNLQSFSNLLKTSIRRNYRPLDPFDRRLMVRRPFALPLQDVAGNAIGPAGAAVSEAHLQRLLQQPGTTTALITVPCALTGNGFSGPVADTSTDPVVIAGFRRDGAGWHMETWVYGGFDCPEAGGTVAWRRHGRWQTAQGVGKQDPVGNWLMKCDLPVGDDLPSIFYIRPTGLSDWLVVGLPAQLGPASAKGVLTKASKDWQVWPRHPTSKEPETVQLASDLADGTLTLVSAWLPLDSSALPLDLPGSRGSSPSDTLNPLRRPPPHKSFGLDGTVVYFWARAGMAILPAPGWMPELLQLWPTR